jgi:hypothetical protein
MSKFQGKKIEKVEKLTKKVNCLEYLKLNNGKSDIYLKDTDGLLNIREKKFCKAFI